MNPRKSRKPETRVIVTIRQSESPREVPLIWTGRAIVLASVPPTKKEPGRRKLFLRIHRCEGLTAAGVAEAKSVADLPAQGFSYYTGQCKHLAEVYGGLYVTSIPSMSIPIDEGTIDSMLDGLIGAQAFLKGQVEKIT